MASAGMARLESEVAELKTVNQSVVTLIEGMAQQIRDNAADEEALNRLADELDAEAAVLAGKVTENTPASNEPPVEEPPANEQ